MVFQLSFSAVMSVCLRCLFPVLVLCGFTHANERTLFDNPPAAEREENKQAQVMDSIKAHVDHLLEFLKARQREKKDDPADLPLVLRTSFSFAQSRSAKSNPISENAAALVALGIVAGESRLSAVVGLRLDEITRRDIERQGQRIRLRDRRDLARHFCLSAALSAMSNESLTNLIGRLKEQSDASGGSGFSFADLMADQAGARLGVQAMRNESSAARVQRVLAKEHQVGLYMPSIKGLPEGISAETLKTEYGGVGGKKYQTLQKEIHRRLEDCSLFETSDR